MGAVAAAHAELPIAVFDSGVGGLTVLHECLVSLPHEDFVYLGDTARFPYGPRSRKELEAFALELARILLADGAKLLVVACNSATAAALPALRRELGGEVGIVSVVGPESRLAARATRNGEVGPARHPGDRRERRLRGRARTRPAVTPHLHPVACPELAPLIQAGGEVDERVVAQVEGYCDPLREADVDTVILGCTHYPLVRPMLQRSLGRGVKVVSSGQAIADEVEVALRQRGPRARRRTAAASTASSARPTPSRSARRHALPAAADGRGRARARSLPRRRWRRLSGAQERRAAPDELRPLTIEPGFMRTATGSALMSMGGTRVICTASVDESVPKWMAGKGRGWVTAEYGMLPASTGERKQRDVSKGRADGRTVEIQRLIGRSLRGVIDFAALGERTVWVDCDVLEADGGTRSAAISGGYVALQLALNRLIEEGKLETPAAHRLDRRRVVRDGGGPRAARPRLLGGLDGRGGRERGDDGRRRPRRGAGDRRAHAAVARIARRAARARRGRHRADPRGAGRGRRRAGGPAGGVRLVLATRNEHKVREFRVLLDPHELVPLPDDVELPPEAGETFDENARAKARAAASAATGMPAIADDSGIEAAALDGRPGMRSARYAGDGASDEENLAKLLAEVPTTATGAWRTCARWRMWSPAATTPCSRSGARANSPTSPAATGASDTTPRSCRPTATTAARWRS